MAKAFLTRNIILQHFTWYFFDQSLSILKGWKNFLLFNLNFFSIPILLKSLFSPWRKYQVSYGRGFDALHYLEALFSNLIFRVLGMILRIILIVSGLFFEVLIFFLGAIVFLFWLTLPFLLIFGLVLGFNFLIF